MSYREEKNLITNIPFWKIGNRDNGSFAEFRKLIKHKFLFNLSFRTGLIQVGILFDSLIFIYQNK